MSNSNLVAFRLPAELQTLFNDAVTASGSDKTSWIVSAIKEKLNRPEGNPDARMLTRVERLESAAASLIAGKADIPPHAYNEPAIVAVVNQVLSEGGTGVSLLNGLTRLAIRQRPVKRGIKISISRENVTRILQRN